MNIKLIRDEKIINGKGKVFDTVRYNLFWELFKQDGFNMCDCDKCRPFKYALYDVSKKIAEQTLERDDKLSNFYKGYIFYLT